MDKVLNFINNLSIDKDSPVIVACSGGPDSLFLLWLLNDLGYKVICAHVNHNVRPSSKDEYIFLEKYCLDNGITFEGTVIDKYDEKMNFHEYAREFRYAFFEKLIRKYDSKFLFTAHHGDDLTETILMRLERGSSLKGYAGFNKVTKKDGYDIIRPLVYLTKSEIEKLDKENNLEYVIDESNDTDHYTRNRFRHHILPYLKEENPSIHLKMLAFSEEMFECASYVEKIVDEFLNEHYHNNILELNSFKKEDPFIQKQILMYILKKWYPTNLYLISFKHVLEILKIIFNENPNLEYDLPNKLHITKEYDKLVFSKEKEVKEDFKILFEDEVTISNNFFKKIDISTNKSNYVIRLNSKDIKLPLYFRNRKEGDLIEVKNMSGSTKVKKIMIDEKLPLSKRDTYPILVDSNDEILWIPGLRKSKKDIPIDEYCDIIVEYQKKEDYYEK